MRNHVLQGNVLETIKQIADKLVNCVVTSPPYWGLRDYGTKPVEWPAVEFSPVAGLPPIRIEPMACSLGLEPDPWAYVAHLVLIFREVWRVLRDDGTLWLNLGDSYASDSKWGGTTGGKHANGLHGNSGIGRQKNYTGLSNKNLVGIPWRVALALQADGWYLRSDIIWSKKNPMPESVTDRPTKSHEYIFLLSKSERYYYDHEAIKEPSIQESQARLMRGVSSTHKNINGAPGQSPHSMNKPRENRNKADSFKRDRSKREQTIPGQDYGTHRPDRKESDYDTGLRNKRTVWEISTRPYADAHFAVFPTNLIEPCILAGCPERVCRECGAPWVRVIEKTDQPAAANKGSYFDRGKTGVNGNGRTQPGERYQNVSSGFEPTCNCNADTRPGIVFDPFLGSGTTAEVAIKNRRDWAGCELNSEYIDLIYKRINGTQVRLFEA